MIGPRDDLQALEVAAQDDDVTARRICLQGRTGRLELTRNPTLTPTLHLGSNLYRLELRAFK